MYGKLLFLEELFPIGGDGVSKRVQILTSAGSCVLNKMFLRVGAKLKMLNLLYSFKNLLKNNNLFNFVEKFLWFLEMFVL